MKYLKTGLAVAAAALIATVPAAVGVNAQGTTVSSQKLNADTIYEGFSARELYQDTTVAGPDDTDIGSVENVIFNSSGKIAGLVVEVGGLWDIGDQHLFVPWKQIEMIGAGENVKVKIPVTEETAEDYTFSKSALFKSDAQNLQDVNSDTLSTGPNLGKFSEIVGDYAYLSDRTGYGYVRDMIIAQDGSIKALVVNVETGYGGGYRAMPYRGFRYSTGPYYSSGLTANQAKVLPNFDYDNLTKM